MADHKLYITESLAAPGDFPALQFEQSIALIDSMGFDRDAMAGAETWRYTCR